jgi:hypothetical protein
MFSEYITRGVLGCSMGFKIFASRRSWMYQREAMPKMSVEDLAREPIGEVIEKASLFEITLTPTPGFEQTACWLADADPYSLPQDVAEMREQWLADREALDRGKITAWPKSAHEVRLERASAQSPAKVAPTPSAQRPSTTAWAPPAKKAASPMPVFGNLGDAMRHILAAQADRSPDCGVAALKARAFWEGAGRPFSRIRRGGKVVYESKYPEPKPTGGRNG